eukprot:1377211-Amorphochlora_amoeboformis.AAC.1
METTKRLSERLDKTEKKLAQYQALISVQELKGALERLEQDIVDILVNPDLHCTVCFSSNALRTARTRMILRRGTGEISTLGRFFTLLPHGTHNSNMTCGPAIPTLGSYFKVGRLWLGQSEIPVAVYKPTDIGELFGGALFLVLERFKNLYGSAYLLPT